MGGFRHVSVLAILLIIAFALISGCDESQKKLEVSNEQREITQTKNIYAEEQYTVQENRIIGEKCIERHYSELNNSRFRLSHSEPDWVGEPIMGESNYLRRVATVFNALDEIKMIYVDKIYLYNGTEIKRSKNPMKFMVDPKSTRTLYVVWNTQYDPLKDVMLDFTNKTEQLGFETSIMRMCYNETENFNVTKTREILIGTEEEVIGYDKFVKVKLERK